MTLRQGEKVMNHNKNRAKDQPKSEAELRKMEPRDYADAGMKNGQKEGLHDGGHEKMREDKT